MVYQIRYRILLIILSVSALTNGSCQDLISYKDGIKGCCIIETIEIKEIDVLVNDLWLKDTIAIRSGESITV